MARGATAAIDAAQTAAAASTIVATRSGRIHAAMRAPDGPRDPELTRMMTEKFAAATDSSLAAWRAVPALHAAMLRWTQDQCRLSVGFALDLCGARSPGAAMDSQLRFVEASVARAGAAGAELTGRWLGLTTRAAAPVRRAVRANATRLNGRAGRE